MKLRHALLSLAIAACVSTPALAQQTPARETADQFVARINGELKEMYPQITVPQWLAATYISDDTQMLAAKSDERWLTLLNVWIEQAKTYEGQPMSAESARTLQLLKLSASMPPPKNPAHLAELTRIASKMGGMYGAGTYCKGEGDAKNCRQLGELEDVLRNNRDYDAQLDAWQGWHTIAVPMKKDYQRFVELSNEGARDLGFANTGELWRSGYDMTPAEIASETDRLWAQVEPLYEELHCYTREKLKTKYGEDKGQVDGGLLPAHLMGNMWQQDWGNLWDVLAPYPDAGSLDITGALEKQYQSYLADEKAKPAGRSPGDIEHAAQMDIAVSMTKRAEDFYTSLGMPKLPASYWNNTQFIKPRDRDVVCHASAWDMDMKG
ncbi:MAG: M2 family metallopeptidase, partial [Xanthomonadaceae bacterium]|nr:M2 family metallopeptidase [Xanthomonadaceae bacterium]